MTLKDEIQKMTEEELLELRGLAYNKIKELKKIRHPKEPDPEPTPSNPQ